MTYLFMEIGLLVVVGFILFAFGFLIGGEFEESRQKKIDRDKEIENRLSKLERGKK